MDNQNDTNILKMVDRACVILEHLYKMDESASISALSKELDLPKANIFRILFTMQQRGIIEKEKGTDLYRLGKKLIKYGEKVRYDINLVELSKYHMKELAQKIGETINIGIKHEDSIITLHSEEGEKSVLVSRLIPVAELHCSSMGKLILADMKKEDIDKYFENNLKKRTVNTITELDVFNKEKDEIVSDGIAHDREEYEYGLSCVSVPIRNKDKEIHAMISVSGPTTRLEFKGLDMIEEQLRKLAIKIEQELI
jgi:IclR family KDG regulon transcriptional repressor